jgi:hypothetical protein
MKSKLLWLTLASIVFLGALHAIGDVFYLYWNSFWFDGLAHFLGGFAMGLIFLWIWFASGIFERSVPNKREAFLAAVLFALFIGVSWEFFEFVYGIANPVGGNYPIDTFHDVCFDFIGGVIAGLLGRIKSFYV